MIKVKVSATSANIGAGFDCMGLALDLYNEIILDTNTSKKLEIITDGNIPTDETNLVYASMKKVFEIVGKTPNIKMTQINNIPLASGLGSSAACVVAGVTGANAVLNYPLSESEIVDICSMLDGHPDNVVPAIIGGTTAGVIDNGKVTYVKCNPGKNLVLYGATPDFELSTTSSRAVLPQNYSRADVVYSLSRAVVTFAALVNGELDKLKIVSDKLHEPYRKPLIKGYAEIEKILMDNGALSVYLSGAGPTIMGFFKTEKNFGLPDGWTLRKFSIVSNGVTIEHI